ncbi:MAG TPA: hypothetical protein VGW36_08385, partial [Pyrinomonadaceae bacterium]|nr:hypothetical protein [Pyrinomonadaceae bacterium]
MDQYEESGDLTIRGTLPKLKQEDAKRLAVYLVRGDEVIAQAPVDESGKFELPVDRAALSKGSEFQVEAVVGPAAMGKRLDPSMNLHRIPLDPREIEGARKEFIVPA